MQLHKMKTVQLGEDKTERQYGASWIPNGSLKLESSDIAHSQFQFKKTKWQNNYACYFYVHDCIISSYKLYFYLQRSAKQNVFLWVTILKQY